MNNIDNELMLTNAQINFFEVEIENERHGGISPSILDSAMDSLVQAPSDIIVGWCNDDTVRDETLVGEFIYSISNLRDRFGGETTLDSLLPRPSKE